MKKLFTLLVLIATMATFAQAPQGFNYQATVRNSAGALIVNQNVYFKFNLMQNSTTSVPVYSETHYVPTDDLGQINLVVGQGTANTGTFAAINWGTGNYYLGIELNTGSGYVAMGTTQLLSVPYALYAEKSGSPGTNGSNGLSAYQVAVANGFVGTEAQWLASLVGAQGPTGNSSSYDNPANVILLDNTTSYTVPPGKVARISNFLFNNSLASGSGSNYYSIININNQNVFLGGGANYFSLSSSYGFWAKIIFSIKNEIWLPEGTVITCPSIMPLPGFANLISSVNILEYQNSNIGVKLITNLQSVPVGKKWKITSVLPNIPITTCEYGQFNPCQKDFSIKINSNINYVGAVRLGADGGDNSAYESLDGPIWLPSGTTLEPYLNIYGITIQEY